MASVIKYNIVNGNAEADTPLESALQTYGENYEARIIRRNFFTGDIGTDAGQTRHADGCLIVDFKSTLIKGVTYELYTPSIDDDGFYFRVLESTEIRVSFDPIDGISRLHILDLGSVDSQRINAGDYGLFTIILGNS